jgi:hypothetical protein
MANAARTFELAPLERRRHQRVKVALLGRFMLEDQREYPCQTINMSPRGLALLSPVLPRKGERVIAYIDQIGRFDGTVARVFDNGFAVTISATPRRREKLAETLTWLANRDADQAEDRRHARVAPRDPRSLITMPTGSTFPCVVVDVSLSGAAVCSEVRPPIGTRVTLGRTAALVVRHIENGFAVEFNRSQQMSMLDDDLRLPDSGF